MDASDGSNSQTPSYAAERTRALRIYYFDLLEAGPVSGWAAALENCARLGFTEILIPPPFTPSANGNRFLAGDYGALHPALAEQCGSIGAAPDALLRRLAMLCDRLGLTLLLDLVLDRVAANGAIARAHPTLFAAPDEAALLDPRRHVDADAAAADLAAPGRAIELAGWLSGRLREWQQAGVGGFRLLGLDGVPAERLAELIGALRRGAPGALMLAWTPGMDWNALPGLAGLGLDGVFASLPWWDWQADWLWNEIELLRPIAPVIGMAEAPFGPRLAATTHDPALLRALYQRALVFAGTIGSGWLVPMGFENASTIPLDPHANGSGAATEAVAIDLSAEIIAVNELLGRERLLAGPGELRLLAGSAAPVLALLRTDAADCRFAERAVLLLANTDLTTRQKADPSLLLPAAGGRFTRFRPVLPAGADPFEPDHPVVLGPAEIRLYLAAAPRRAEAPAPLDPAAASAAAALPRLAIEGITPAVDDGAFPAKRIGGEFVTVEADVICDGHDKLAVALQWRGPASEDWEETRMRPLGNDRFQAAFPLTELGDYQYRVEAWRDRFETYREELAKKYAGGVRIDLELIEGEGLVRAALERSTGAPAEQLQQSLDALINASADSKRETLLSPALCRAMAVADDRPFAVRSAPLPLIAERGAARFASWYEMFPRSASDDPNRHGTFRDVERHLPRIRAMGFDVLYFPPIHPIGATNRKGRNNSLQPAPTDPGSPYAIGSAAGGHDALHPELGSFDDFRHLLRAAAAHGIEIALDFAIQCSPDHPWLREHKGWFDWRPDGSIRYAENPPKKYEDIVNVDFYAADAVPDLWIALCEVVLFWAKQGVRLFRVDNPHTKPLPFWQWMIGEVRRRYPEAIFLAEAFTRPKVMYRLAKVGFSQSYTYFTWRNTKRELQDYLVELSTTAPRDFFRPHFFVNTPDINPVFLQNSGRPGFLIRAALAATLSGLWGLYSGFELCEARALPGREEYLDSEKYEIKAWDWNRPGNIVTEISQLNRIRRANPALQTHLNVSFHNAFNDAILYYEKATPDRSNVVLVAVSLDPFQAQEADFEVPLWNWNLSDSAAVDAEDLLHGGTQRWQGKIQHLRLTPEQPYAIWRIRPVV